MHYPSICRCSIYIQVHVVSTFVNTERMSLTCSGREIHILGPNVLSFFSPNVAVFALLTTKSFFLLAECESFLKYLCMTSGFEDFKILKTCKNRKQIFTQDENLIKHLKERRCTGGKMKTISSGGKLRHILNSSEKVFYGSDTKFSYTTTE